MKILIIDNQEEITDLLAVKVQNHYDVDITTAASGTEGLAKSFEESFDLVLTDFNMPGLDGVDLTRSVRTHKGPNQEIPLVFITSHIEEAQRKTTDLEGIFFVDKLSFSQDFSKVVEDLKIPSINLGKRE